MSSTTKTTFATRPGEQPGGEFFMHAVGSFRPIAACLQAVYIGTELNKAGVMAGGNITAK
jgi:hypothetical protein